MPTTCTHTHTKSHFDTNKSSFIMYTHTHPDTRALSAFSFQWQPTTKAARQRAVVHARTRVKTNRTIPGGSDGIEHITYNIIAWTETSDAARICRSTKNGSHFERVPAASHRVHKCCTYTHMHIWYTRIQITLFPGTAEMLRDFVRIYHSGRARASAIQLNFDYHP